MLFLRPVVCPHSASISTSTGGLKQIDRQFNITTGEFGNFSINGFS